MPVVNWNKELLDQLDFAWEARFLPRMEGLTDDEYLWGPVSGCWSIRPDDAGIWRMDWEQPEPSPPPLTTIAWRLMHIADVFGDRASNHFGDGSVSLMTGDLPSTAKEGLALVQEQYALWHAGVESLGEDGLNRESGASEGDFAEYPLAMLVLHINREFLHHAAEVMLLRDLYLRMAP